MRWGRQLKLLWGRVAQWWQLHWKGALEIFTVFMLAVTAVAAWRSADLANRTSKQTILFQSELSANETWRNYRDLQLTFRIQTADKFEYPSGDIGRDSDYEMRNERLLMAADLMTFMNEVENGWNDPQWEDSFVVEFQENRDFFLNDKFLAGSQRVMSDYCTYRAPVRTWLIGAFEGEPVASARLRSAEAECERLCSDRPGCS